MRKGRYQKNFLQPDQCPQWGQGMAAFIPDLKNKLAETFSDAEFVAAYFLAGFEILHAKNWKGARFNANLWPEHWLTTFVEQSPLKRIAQYSLRGIPLSANRTLLAWQAGEYQLKLFFSVPSIAEVLQMQRQGVRCVTCLCEPEELQKYVLAERDPLSFTLHDLIHADHFFHDQTQRTVQIGFSRWLWLIWQAQEPLRIAESHPHFLTQFEYVSADMNSHGAHLSKYLKAILCQCGQENVLSSWAELGGFHFDFIEALTCLNTENEMGMHLQIIQQELFNKGSESLSLRSE